MDTDTKSPLSFRISIGAMIAVVHCLVIGTFFLIKPAISQEKDEDKITVTMIGSLSSAEISEVAEVSENSSATHEETVRQEPVERVPVEQPVEVPEVELEKIDVGDVNFQPPEIKQPKQPVEEYKVPEVKRRKPVKKPYRARTPEEIRNGSNITRTNTKKPFDTSQLRDDLGNIDKRGLPKGRKTTFGDPNGTALKVKYGSLQQALGQALHIKMAPYVGVNYSDRDLYLTVRYTVTKSGRVSGVRIIKGTGVAELDARVRQVSRNLRVSGNYNIKGSTQVTVDIVFTRK